ncbi:MAG TPA: adenylyltransferase, partial [Archaeoglobaceae archaeon]|nr:adenylyltransferase [Archaeoglobaceae archaeon]
MVPDFGEKGQEKLSKSKILVVGAGGLGSTAIAYLAAAGVGKIGIVDGDKVEESNLQRQILHAGKIGMN